MKTYNALNDPYFTITSQFERYLNYLKDQPYSPFLEWYTTRTLDQTIFYVLTNSGLYAYKPIYLFTSLSGVPFFRFDQLEKSDYND